MIRTPFQRNVRFTLYLTGPVGNFGALQVTLPASAMQLTQQSPSHTRCHNQRPQLNLRHQSCYHYRHVLLKASSSRFHAVALFIMLLLLAQCKDRCSTPPSPLLVIRMSAPLRGCNAEGDSKSPYEKTSYITREEADRGKEVCTIEMKILHRSSKVAFAF